MTRNLAITIFIALAVCAAGWFVPASDAQAQDTPTLTGVTARSVGTTVVEVTVTADNLRTSTQLYRRYRLAGGGWSSSVTNVASSPATYTIGGLAAGTTYDIEVSFDSGYATSESVTHAHVGTRLIYLDVVDDQIRQITNLTNISGSDALIGAFPAGFDAFFAGTELDGWVYLIDEAYHLWRSRTPTVVTSYTDLGLLSITDKIDGLAGYDGALYAFAKDDMHRIGDPSGLTGITTSSLPQDVIDNDAWCVVCGATTVASTVYFVDDVDHRLYRVTDTSNPGAATSVAVGNHAYRALTDFNGRLFANDESPADLYEITNFDSASATTTKIGDYNTASTNATAMFSWSGISAPIASSISSTVGAGTAAITVTATAADSGGRTFRIRYRETSTTGTWTTASASSTTATRLFNVTGLTGGTSYDVQASLSSGFPSDDRAVTTVTPTAVATVAPTLSPSPAGTPLSGSTSSETTVVSPAGPATVTVLSGPGDADVKQTFSSLECVHPLSDTLSVAHNDRIWFRWCVGGSMQVVITLDSDTSFTTSYTVNIDSQTVPIPPTNLTAVRGNGSVALRWDAPTDVGGSAIIRYEYSSNDGVNWTTTGSSATTYTVTGLTNGTEYTLRVRAVNTNGDGWQSASVTATPATVPGVPRNVTAIGSDQQVYLDWDAPTSNGGTAITEYEYSSNDGISWRGTGSAETEYIARLSTISPYPRLENDRSYLMHVRARNSLGVGPESPFAVGRTSANTVPGAPTGLATTTPGNRQVALSWDAPDDTGGHLVALTQYSYSSNDGSLWTTTGSTTTSVTVSGLTNGTEYTFRVRAHNSLGFGAASASVTGTPVGLPGTVTGLTATGRNLSVDLSWNAPGDNGSAIIRYEYKQGSAGWVSTGSATTSYTVTGLTNGTTYVFRVRAVNGEGNGGQSATASAEPTSASTPHSPGNLVALSGDTELYLTWDAPDDGGSPITSYEYSINNGGSFQTTGSAETSYTITGLTNGSLYIVRVRSRNIIGHSGNSNNQYARPQPAPTVTGLSFADIASTSVTVNVTVRNLGSQTGTVHGRYRTPAGSGAWTDVTDVTVGETSNTSAAFSITGLDPASEYRFEASTSTSYPNGNRGSEDFTTLEAGGVSTATVGSITQTSASVSIVLDNPDAQSTTVYARYRTPVDSGLWDNLTEQTTTGTSATFSLPSLAAYTEYRFEASIASDYSSATQEDFTTSATPAVISSAAAGSTTSDGTTITVSLTNPHSQSATVWLRYRTPVGSGAWTEASSTQTTTGGSVTFTLSGLDRATEYRAQAALTSSYATTHQTDFTTLTPTLTGISIGSITRETAVVTLTIANSDGDAATFYLRHGTPPSSPSWTTTITLTATGGTTTESLTGLFESTEYRVQVSASNTFSSPQQADFTAAVNSAPTFTASTLTRHIDEGAPAGSNVGAPVAATDSDGDSIAYTLGGTDAASFVLSATAQITVGAGVTLDYETKTSYSVTVTAADYFAASSTTTVTIQVDDVREAGLLGRIVLTVGNSGSTYGYTGSYGALISGDFPGDLFDDGNDRTVAEIYEDADGYWYFTYSGGLANDWLSAQEELDEMMVEVEYADDLDTRSFVLGGFIDSRTGTRGLKLDPPLPSRDWNDKDAEEVAVSFRRHKAQAAAIVLPAALVNPTATLGSVGWLLNQTPGDGVTTQLLITMIVFCVVVFGKTFARVKSRSGGKGGAQSPVMVAVVLAVTPWAPAVFGFGSFILSTLIAVMMVASAYVYRQGTKQVR